MSALRQIQAEYDVARLEKREIHRGIRLGARMWLDVGGVGGEQLLHPVDRALLDHVHELASTVVAFSRQSLGVLIGQRGSHGFEHRHRDEVFARDQLKSVTLPIDLEIDEARDLLIALSETARRHCNPGRWFWRSCLCLGHQMSWGSIFLTRRSWRPPSNLASNQTFMVSTA